MDTTVWPRNTEKEESQPDKNNSTFLSSLQYFESISEVNKFGTPLDSNKIFHVISNAPNLLYGVHRQLFRLG